MLTETLTIESPLDPSKKIALDNQKVCEAFIQAYEAGDKQTALEYAKVVMLKAMSMNRWVFHNLWKLWKTQNLKKSKISLFWFFEFFRNLKN